MNADEIAATRDCAHCRHGHHFTPRADEIARYGESVMGCRRPNWEGYTRWNSVCEAFAIRAALTNGGSNG